MATIFLPTGLFRRAHFSAVETRGRIIKRRREAHGYTSLRQFEPVAGVARATLAKIESGTASIDAVVKVEHVLDELDRIQEIDSKALAQEPDPDAESGDLIEFDIKGPTTSWHVVVRGPIEAADEVRHQAAELLKDIEGND